MTIPQDKVRKLVPSGMVAHELLHTGQNLVTDGVKIDLRFDQKGGHLVILPRQKLKLPICILRQFGRLKFLPIGQTVQSDLHGVDSIGLHLAILCEQNRFIRSELTTETNIPFSNKAVTTGQW